MKKIKCEYCRGKNNEDNDECRHCGAPLPEPPQALPVFYYGTRVDDGFFLSSGTTIDYSMYRIGTIKDV